MIDKSKYEMLLERMGQYPDMFTHEDRQKLWQQKPRELNLEETIRFLPYEKVDPGPATIQREYQPQPRPDEQMMLNPREFLENYLEHGPVENEDDRQLKKLIFDLKTKDIA